MTVENKEAMPRFAKRIVSKRKGMIICLIKFVKFLERFIGI